MKKIALLIDFKANNDKIPMSIHIARNNSNLFCFILALAYKNKKIFHDTFVQESISRYILTDKCSIGILPDRQIMLKVECNERYIERHEKQYQ